MTTLQEDALPPGLLEERGEARLHLGGTERKAGWKNLNAQPSASVDFVGDIRDLTQFGDASQDMVYASHVLEHLGYQKDLPHALAEIVRVLKPEGRFFVSVPDLAVMCRLFADRGATNKLRIAVMRMMFGGQIDPYDFHFVGLWDEYLAFLLFKAGFSAVYRVKSFGLFDDTSELTFDDVAISLNMVAVK
ncbi:MAG: methyltransferase domain-containing protein [Polyangiaceae bacterium]|jgi:predicted SAM-dependent methyltransferase|nr:methyltransferase domain-containing protein [Polyangiaceae bacterium]MBK8939418.1 methyltransferase domain-containing protein [Polyangiaceae bacterium]